MIKVKCNYKNGYSDHNCRLCKNGAETQNHILYECQVLHPHGKPGIKQMDPFSENINILKETANNVGILLEHLSNGSMDVSTISSITPANPQ